MWGLSGLRLPPDLLSRWEDLVRAGVKDKKKTFFFVTDTEAKKKPKSLSKEKFFFPPRPTFASKDRAYPSTSL